MPPQARTVISGISAVGHITDPYGTPVKVPWGATEQDGVSINISPERFQVISGQSLVAEEDFVSAIPMDLLFRLQYSDLLTFARAFGLADDDAGLTGDLFNETTPVEEVFEPLMASISKTDRYLYAETPGPVGIRTYEFKRCRLAPSGSISLSSTAAQIIEVQSTILRPKESGHENTPFKIIDAL